MANRDLSMETNYAWAAGIVDGEGHFHFILRETRPGHTIRGITLSVPQTHPEMLERLASLFGGKVRKRKPPKNPRHSQRWDWLVSGYDRVEFATQAMWPWLGTVKREQATQALESWLADSPNRLTHTSLINRRMDTVHGN